jgi:hypothetical protein
MYEWVLVNKELSAGVLGAVAVVVAAVISKKRAAPVGSDSSNTNSNINTIIVGNHKNTIRIPSDSSSLNKDTARILFVDDDTTFQVVRIIKKAGWCNVKAIKDIDSLDAPSIKEADLFFIDIQGVGKALKFKDEGLGLALALKDKYPNKKVVIYSAEPRGDRFHQAFRVADDFLSKTAEPYEFQQVIENLLLDKGM